MVRVLRDWLVRLRGSRGATDRRKARLLAGARPVTPEECLIVDVLATRGRLAVDALVSAVAAALYREELAEGAGAVDVGFLSAQAFVPDVKRTLEHGEGRLWTISA